MGHRALAALTVFAATIGLACANEGGSERGVDPVAPVEISDGWLAMGTFFEIEIHLPRRDLSEAQEWLTDARYEIARLEKIYSRYDPSSELSKLNRRLLASPDIGRDPAGDPRVSRELAQLLERARDLREDTRGAFDVAYAAPRIDLDAISKGAVLDALRRDFSRRLPDSAALLNFGQSSVVAIGAPHGADAWRLVLQSREPARGRLGEITLRDQALSMSSAIQSDRDSTEGVSASIVDPRSGDAIDAAIEALVLAESALVADAWSTALLVWGEIPAWLASAEGGGEVEIEAMFFARDGRVTQTAGFANRVRP